MVSLPNQEAYTQGKIPITKKKLEDLKKVMPYIVEELQDFFEELFKWPVTDEISCNDDV